MSKNHLQERVEETWKLQEKSKKSQGREAKVVGEGVILEEAIVRCGSREQLHAAVSRGAIKILRAGGLQLFQFPSHQNSMTERVTTEVESTATSGSNADIHAAMRSQSLTSVAMEVPELPRILGCRPFELAFDYTYTDHWTGPCDLWGLTSTFGFDGSTGAS